METRYRVTGTRKGDKTAKVVTFHDTNQQADWWVVEHYAEENGAHAYEVALCEDSDEGYRIRCTYYVVDLGIVNESVYLQAIEKGKH